MIFVFMPPFRKSPVLDSPLTAFVLAGGRSSRMGKDKALLPVRNRYLIQNPIQVLRRITADVRIIGDPKKYGFLKLPVTPDCIEPRGPLTGIYTALRASPSFFNLIVGCDMPRISLRFLRLLLAKVGWGDVVMMKFDDGLVEPLCALYSQACLTAIEENLRRHRYKISDLFSSVQVEYVLERDIGKLGLTRDIFTNINTPKDWETWEAKNPG
jgi:molybdenum cofactor guanylyltransferase